MPRWPQPIRNPLELSILGPRRANDLRESAVSSCDVMVQTMSNRLGEVPQLPIRPNGWPRTALNTSLGTRGFAQDIVSDHPPVCVVCPRKRVIGIRRAGQSTVAVGAHIKGIGDRLSCSSTDFLRGRRHAV